MKLLVIALITMLSISSSYAENNSEVYENFFNKKVLKFLSGFRIPNDNDLGYYWKEKESFVYKTKDDTVVSGNVKMTHRGN